MLWSLRKVCAEVIAVKLDNVLGIHEEALRLRAQRSEVLAANLANADTPGYKARDFDFAAILRREVQAPVRLAATHGAHFGVKQTGTASPQLGYRVPQQPSVDGNTVEVEREQARFSENAMRYQASLRFLDSRIQGLKLAIKGSG
jgi:flagellar basal-body rod protein FlgB